MRARLARAYGTPQAVVGSALVVLVGLVLAQRTLGVTRQPLPLVWPLAVLHVVIAQLPLREILGPVERAAVRGRQVRIVRAAVVLVLLTAGAVTYVYANGNRDLLVFFLAVAAVGFTAAAESRAEPWAWTLGMGMAVIGLAFLTPLGGPISRGLASLPLPVALMIVTFAVVGYVLHARLTPRA